MKDQVCNQQGEFQIRIPAEPAYLVVVRAAVKAGLERLEMPAQDVDGMILALDEALANAIKHSYKGPCGKPIDVTMRHHRGSEGKAGMVELLVRDFGQQVDPATIKSRDLDDVRPGGLGVHIMESVMDELEYQRADETGMVVRMTKQIQEADGPDVNDEVKDAVG